MNHRYVNTLMLAKINIFNCTVSYKTKQKWNDLTWRGSVQVLSLKKACLWMNIKMMNYLRPRDRLFISATRFLFYKLSMQCDGCVILLNNEQLRKVRITWTFDWAHTARWKKFYVRFTDWHTRFQRRFRGFESTIEYLAVDKKTGLSPNWISMLILGRSVQ